MKILLKHNKLYPVSFMAHLDVLRAVTRIIRRAALPVAFSQGYSPHMKLFFNQPLPLAVESRAEYLSVELEEDISPEEFLRRYNGEAPVGMEAVSATESDVNPASETDSALYFAKIRLSAAQTDVLREIAEKKEFFVTYAQKDKTVTKDVRDQIGDLSAGDGGIYMKLAAGNVNLRADRFMNAFCEMAGTEYFIGDIIRLEQYSNGTALCDIKRE